MLEYLILNNRLEAAGKFNEISPKNYKQQLLTHFNKGKRVEFLKTYLLLRHEKKLQFYVRVYFLIYNIHPALKAKNTIPQEQVNAFKQYLDTKGADLAKTNQFLQFYALPFVKKPLEHASYKNLFKKEWINNLSEKLNIFLHDQDRRMKQIVMSFTNSVIQKDDDSRRLKSPQFVQPSENINLNLKNLQEKNKKLFQQIEQFKQKYVNLQQSNQAMIQSFNSYMMESQNKWFQITKQLTNNSKTLIQLIVKSNSTLINDRKFLRIKKKTEKYQKFVRKELDQLMSQSQDISIFDKPSVNQISYSASITPNITQRNATTFVSIDQFTPTNYIELMKDFKKMSDDSKITIIRGFSWRIIKSKDKWIRRQTIIGMIVNDFLGLRTGDIMELLLNKNLMFYVLELFSFTSEDSYGSKVLFRNSGFYKQLIQLIPQVVKDKNYACLAKILDILESLSPNKEMILQLINLNVIDIYVSILLEDQIILNNEDMLQNVLALMLNMTTVNEGLYAYESQINIFFTLSQAFNLQNQLIRTLIGGIIYSLIGQETLWALAHEAKVPEFIDELLKYTEVSINKKQLKIIQDKLKVFQSGKIIQHAQEDDDESIDSNLQEQIFERNQQELNNLEQYIKGHEMLNGKYFLKNKEAQKQLEQINRIMNQFQKKREDVTNKQKIKKQYVQIVMKKPINSNKDLSKLPEIKNKKVKEEHSSIKGNPPLKQKLNNQQFYSYKSPNFKQNQRRNVHSQQAESFSYFKEVEMDKVNVDNFQIFNKNSEKIDVNKPSNNKKQDRYSQIEKKQDKQKRQKNSTNKPEYRIKKSSSVQKKLGNVSKKHYISYESNKNSFPVAQTKLINEQKKIKSSPQKKTREEVLRQLNQQLKAEFKMDQNKQRKLSQKNIINNINVQSENAQVRKNNFVGTDEDLKAFASRPKIRRTPPRQDE